MKIIHKLSLSLILLFFVQVLYAQYDPVIPNNRMPVSLEHNILFNATERYTVEINKSIISLEALFDGSFASHSSSEGISESNPLIITIKDLPRVHTYQVFIHGMGDM
ncbi:hypothetical protein AAG747_21210 [Rapidithrix thailandica]|uniref:DUF3244 domain-containing protein n=1 Tax=Rapidithrix thailandica TaxID=413964 RepID=A0AAW9RZX4_9BACT